MQAQETGGVILFISSVSATRPSPGTAAYGAAKAGLESLVRSLAVEWAPKVRVVGVAGGMVDTEQSHLYYGDAEGIAASGRPCRWGGWRLRATSGRRAYTSPRRSRPT